MIWRIVSIVGIVLFLAGCQAPAATEAPTATARSATTAPTADELSPTADAAAEQASPTSEAETATPRRLRIVASATAEKSGVKLPPPGVPGRPASQDGQAGFQWEALPGHSDWAACVAVLVVGFSTENWVLRVDNSELFDDFKSHGTALVCDVPADQNITVTVLDANNNVVPGAQSIPARRGQMLYGQWVDINQTATPDIDSSARGLRFRLSNSAADPHCVIVIITGVDLTGWSVKANGIDISAPFEELVITGICDLQERQEITFTVYDNNNNPVAGGVGIPARGGDTLVADWGAIAEAPTAVPATKAPVSDNRALRFALKDGSDDTRCISVQIRGIATSGWVLRADGLKVSAKFDDAGNARMCGLKRKQEFTFSVFNAKGGAVPGGGGIPARGGNIFVADWR